MEGNQRLRTPFSTILMADPRGNIFWLGIVALMILAATDFALAEEPRKVSPDNSSSVAVQLSAEQRTQVRNAVIETRNAWRVSSVDFALAVGSEVPRGRIQAVPVPDVLLQIKPEWRGLLYFVYEGEVIIVDPDDMRIVAIVPG